MLEFIGFEDNKKIGMILLVMAVLCYFFGITFLFKRSFLILSNVLFMFGLYFFVGINGIIKFFTKKGKVKGTIVLCIGFALLVIGFAFIGAIVQIAGFFFIFRSFLPDFYEYVCKIPFVGKYLKSYWLQNFLDDIAGNQQSRI